MKADDEKRSLRRKGKEISKNLFDNLGFAAWGKFQTVHSAKNVLATHGRHEMNGRLGAGQPSM